MTDRDLKPENSHCRHAQCCQCSAKRGTPEHEAECMAARVSRALNRRLEGYVPRKLSRRVLP